MNEPVDRDPLAPGLSERDRKMFERAVRELQAHSVIADFDSDDEDMAELFHWAEKNQPLLEAYFRIAGLGIRAHVGIPVIQLILDDADESHPLRQRFDKAETGLLICLWLLYHELVHEADGLVVPVTVEDIYSRLSVLFPGADKVLPQGIFEGAIKRFARYRLVQFEMEENDFMRGRVGLLPTLTSTFRFADASEAKAAITPKPDAKS